jgi:hypothetical protein
MNTVVAVTQLPSGRLLGIIPSADDSHLSSYVPQTGLSAASTSNLPQTRLFEYYGLFPDCLNVSQ